ncbi:hypothetical protein I0L81_001348 [Listeria monocytogenes]|nr:hypothetical protein [Listeria monocytogenes]EGP8476465.1 hypothetical protein [Listeria monocytogenes]EGP8503165.1 hypothetical protein [Listeria monocytogenes]EGP8522979.1 hypothetical protein [Listeria monocytogenes]EGP9801968.1 hypothetical protein [Listeria monocytogenes]
MKLPDYLTPKQHNEINQAIKKKTPILITGKQGPTGKTALKNLLKKEGVVVFEQHDCLIIELNEILP